MKYHIGLSLRFKDKNTHIILEKPSVFCRIIFTMTLYDFFSNSFSLNFPNIRENRNSETITIRYDVGHPVSQLQSSNLKRFEFDYINVRLFKPPTSIIDLT